MQDDLFYLGSGNESELSSCEQDARRHFITELIGIQGKLKTFISCIIFDKASVPDIIQEINLFLLENESSFDPDQDFAPWAFAIARNSLKSYLRNQKRDRHNYDSEMLDLFASTPDTIICNEYDSRKERMQHCLNQLSADQRRMLHQRYSEGRSVMEIAESQRKKPNAISQIIFRLRQVLLRCVEQKY